MLGIKLTDDQKWNEQIWGSGGVIPSLNQRFFLLRRLKNKISKTQLTKVADSIFTSKIRYGVQLYGKVRFNEKDPENCLIEDIQLVQKSRSYKGVSSIPDQST